MGHNVTDPTDLPVERDDVLGTVLHLVLPLLLLLQGDGHEPQDKEVDGGGHHGQAEKEEEEAETVYSAAHCSIWREFCDRNSKLDFFSILIQLNGQSNNNNNNIIVNLV